VIQARVGSNQSRAQRRRSATASAAPCGRSGCSCRRGLSRRRQTRHRDHAGDSGEPDLQGRRSEAVGRSRPPLDGR
jgi:hypothetical protein